MRLHTFVILAHNESDDLEECIKSVINQSVKSNVVVATSTPNDERKQIIKALEPAMAADCSSDLYILGSNIINQNPCLFHYLNFCQRIFSNQSGRMAISGGR